MIVTAIAKHIIAKRNEFQNLKSVPFLFFLKKLTLLFFLIRLWKFVHHFFNQLLFHIHIKTEITDKGKLLKLFSSSSSTHTKEFSKSHTPYEYYPATLRSCFFPSYRLLHRYFPCQIPNPQQNICLSVALTKSQYL